MAAIFTMAAIAAWAIATERVSYVVTYGISMHPVYHADDLVFVVKADSYETGQIAAYHGTSPGQRVLHRIIGGDAETGFVLKGDNNQSIDAVRPTADAMIGRAVLHVPRGGAWLAPLLSPTGLGMLGFLFASGGVAATRTRRDLPRGRRKKRVKAMAQQGGSWAAAVAVAKTVRRLPPAVRAVAVLASVVAVLALVLGVLGWMKPTTTEVRRAATTGPSMTFSYSAKVPDSPAYDSPIVRAPEPIFRKLANLVDVQMRYRGEPGTLDVTAELSTVIGWHTTRDILRAKKFTENDYNVAVQLDLDDFARRAKAASDAIGMSAENITVYLTARVTAADGEVFQAPLSFELTPLRFGLAGGNTKLVVDTSTNGQTVTEARTIWPLGMTASRARAWAALLLILAIGAAVAVFLIARRETPVRTRSEIERRYPQLIVPVEPMASPPGKPVVNVDNFPALVKLAERYGQMILTWSRPDADDFVVRDEGITYRYRTDLENAESRDPSLMDEGIPPRSRRRVSAKGVLTGSEDRPTSHRYTS